MHKLRLVCRVLLALALTVFGADKFLHFLEMPEPPPEGGAFLVALTEAGYVFPTIGLVFLVSALCLITGRVALGLLLLAPVLVNILEYHLRFDPAGIGGGAVLTALWVVLAVTHVGDFGPLLRPTARDRG